MKCIESFMIVFHNILWLQVLSQNTKISKSIISALPISDRGNEYIL